MTRPVAERNYLGTVLHVSPLDSLDSTQGSNQRAGRCESSHTWL